MLLSCNFALEILRRLAALVASNCKHCSLVGTTFAATLFLRLMLSDNFKLRIRSGESFLYRKEGTESQVFELRMRDKVSHFALQRAYRKALKRYPYFNSSFIKRSAFRKIF